MAEDSVALRYAVVAFSALVYSVKVQHCPALQVAFSYYTMAIRELQLLLNNLAYQKGETAIATALQLATFDVTTSSLGYANNSGYWGTQVNAFAIWVAWRV